MAEQELTTGEKRVDQKLTCPKCGLVQNEFWQDKGKGYVKDSKIYCCRSCAEENSCTCLVPGGGG